MTIRDIDAVKQELADLRAKITAYGEQKNANEKAAGRIKEYRDVLENMTDRALKTFSMTIPPSNRRYGEIPMLSPGLPRHRVPRNRRANI